MTERLWAPWRLGYVARPADAPPEEPACFLCRIQADDPARDRDNLLVERGRHSVAVLNRFPYNNGHLLIAPARHLGRLDELSPEVMLDGLEMVRRYVAVLEKAMTPDGFNVGLNLGRAAGAGLPGHLHWHIVPRWNGDVNFMTVLTDTRVIVQSLDAAWEVLTRGAADGR